MKRDRDDYRAMTTRELLCAARDHGIDAALAVAAVERLAELTISPHGLGQFQWRG